MKKTLATLAIIITALTNSAYSQTITNGNFNSSATGWGCSPEAIYFETTYGGSNGSNRVAEVDQEAGLCQTVSGFNIGALYRLTFSLSRRTTCGPTLQSMNVTVSGGAASQAFSRNGNGFGFSTETIIFTATSTSHTITFTSTITGTCGLIVDNIGVSVVSNLPVEWVDLKAVLQKDHSVQTMWTTESEANSDFFTVEKSTDGDNWAEVATTEAAGMSTERLDYAVTDPQPFSGLSYYRVKQTDRDGNFSYSGIVSVFNDASQEEISVFPNPSDAEITITGIGENFRFVDSFGKEVQCLLISGAQEKNIRLDISQLQKGIYYLISPAGTVPVYRL